MERQRARARRKAGFTLAEVLVTLGIIAVLLALAVPSVAVVQKNLKMAQLNTTAKEIFLAAQNNLTGLSAGGGALELSGKSGTSDPDAVVCLMSGAPEDAEIMEKVLPLGAVDPTVADNHYMVVYYPATLTVKEIYYAERALPAAGETLRRDYGGADKAGARREAEVGFYDGGNAASSPVKSLPKPIVTIENGEELKVVVTVPGVPAELFNKVEMKVSVSDGVNTVVLREGKTLDVGGTEDAIFLDRMWGEGLRFRNVCKGLTPGADVSVIAEVLYTGSDKGTWLSTKESKTTNSLFASRDEDGTVRIACGRHLQNLDTYTSGMKPTGPFTAVQTAAIDWSKSGVSDFYAIQNEWLTGYDGQNNEIKNLQVRAAGSNSNKEVKGVGLFGTTSPKYPVTLANIRLVNANVEGGSYPTGSLIGATGEGGVTVHGCLVYWNGTGKQKNCYVSGGGTGAGVGGLIGTAEKGKTNISYCGVGLPTIKGAKSKMLGGLVGSAKGAVIQNSYAAVDQLSGTAEQIGGFIGHGEEVTVSNCYAVGNLSATRIEEKGTYFINGFLTGSGKVTDSYCAMTYLKETGEPRELKINYGFMYKPGVRCAYLEPNATVTIGNSGEQASELTYEELKSRGANKASWTALSEPDSHSYRTLDKGEPKSYPFPGLLAETGSPLPHYGSWPKEPEEVGAGGGLTYYERYNDGTWGYYTVDLETGAVSDTLKGNELTILETGYGVLLPKGTTPKDLGPVQVFDYHGNMFEEPPLENAVTADGALLYPLADDIMAPINKVISWHQSGATIIVGDQGTFIINPHFGAAILKSNWSADLGVEKSPLQVRTVAQFNSLGSISTLPPNLYFSQTHDIDFGVDGTASGLKLNMGVIYDGKGNRLLHRSSPVFQETNSASTIKNVVVEQANIQNVSNTGILLGRNNGGTVSGCTVIDSVIEGDNVAGLLWQNNSTVENCSFRASTSYESAKVVSVNGRAAGLIGENKGNISRCYAAGTVTGKEASGFAIQAGAVDKSYANCIITGKSGAAGFHYAGSASATDCYSVSTVLVSEKGIAAGFSRSQNWPVLTRCYFVGTVETKDDKAYGFAPYSTNGLEQYYYTPSRVEQNNAYGIMLDYQGLRDLTFPSGGQTWTDGTSETTHPYALAPGEAYPFPRLAALDHWGDWPEEPRGLKAEEDILGAFYYTSEPLANGQYKVTVYTSALKCTNDRDANSYSLEPNPFTVFLPKEPERESGMGVFCSKDFDFSVGGNGNNKGYFYEVDSGNGILLDHDSKNGDLKFDPNYCFIPIEPKKDGDIELDLYFKHDNGSSEKGWRFEFDFEDDDLKWETEKKEDNKH